MASAYLRTSLDRAVVARVTASGAKEKNDLGVVENSVGFYLADVADTAEGAFCVAADKALFPKKTGVTINAGDDVYYDAVQEEVNLTNTNRPCGTCLYGAASDATTVLIDFKQESSGATY